MNETFLEQFYFPATEEENEKRRRKKKVEFVLHEITKGFNYQPKW